MKNNKDNNNGSIPKNILNEISEHTLGGYIIFYFNNNSGAPEHAICYDSPAHCMALQKYISDWDQAIHETTIDSMRQTIDENYEDEQGKSQGEDEDNNIK
jgi:hypothetical protein